MAEHKSKVEGSFLVITLEVVKMDQQSQTLSKNGSHWYYDVVSCIHEVVNHMLTSMPPNYENNYMLYLHCAGFEY